MTSQKLPNWLLKRAELTPNRIALRSQTESKTFVQLHDAAVLTARRLSYFGVKKGERIALLFQNGLHTVEMYHALAYLGAILVPLNTRLSPYELAWQLKDCASYMLVYDKWNAEKVDELKKLVSDSAIQFVTWEEVNQSQEIEANLQNEFDMEDVHTLIYTSGTTGFPKGVMLTYGNHWWSAIGSMLNLGLHDDDQWLACVPFFHVSGLSILMRSVIYGISVNVHSTFDPHIVNEAIKNDGVTIISVVSNMLARMLDALKGTSYPPSFRCMLVGGGPVPLHLLESCKAHNIPVYQTYGMTETASQIVTLSPDAMLTKIGSAGKPLFPAQLRIEREGVSVPNGTIGEIVVSGPNVTRGYYHRPDATAQAIQNGWLHTGDLGYLDEDGFLYVVDRRSDLIISGGENVYPAEVEAVLTSHPCIAEAGVTSKDDDTWGQVPIAFVKRKEGVSCTEESVLDYCRSKLASYKVPKSVYFIDEIPRNAGNKILRRKLKEMIDQQY